MSEQYPDLENKFPLEIDDFDRFIDPSISMLTAINRYKQLYNSGDTTGATAILEQNPILKRAILNAENLNKYRDAIIAIERFYLDDVQEYLINIVKWKSTYNQTMRYTKYNVVAYARNGATETFMAIKTDVPIGTPPTDLDYWVPITLRGEKGESGTGLSGRGTWNAETHYYPDDWVAYNNTIWAAKTEHTNSVPRDNSSDWYPVIRDLQHIVVSPTTPDGQYVNDVWFKILNEDATRSTYQTNVQKTDGTYKPYYPETLAECVKTPDGQTLLEHLAGTISHTTLTLPPDLWSAVDGEDHLYQYIITEPEIVENTKPDTTILDCMADIQNRKILQDAKVSEVWIENTDGVATIFLWGSVPTVDISIQVRINNP